MTGKSKTTIKSEAVGMNADNGASPKSGFRLEEIDNNGLATLESVKGNVGSQ